jgi:hypothetical protein
MVDASLDPVEGEMLIAHMAVVPILALDGSTVTLRTYWREAPTVTGLVRHFGCLFCHQMVHDLTEAAPAILESGANLIIVGNGTVAQARDFFSERGLPRDRVFVLTDPERRSYDAAGAERGLRQTFFNSGSRRAYAKARREGHGISGWLGDLTQLGVLLVTRPPAGLSYIYRSRYAGDHPKMSEVLGAVARRG